MATTLNFQGRNSNAPDRPHIIIAFTPGDKKHPSSWLSETAANAEEIVSKTGYFANEIKKAKALTLACPSVMPGSKYVAGDDISMFRIMVYNPDVKTNAGDAWKQIIFQKAKVKDVRDVQERDPISVKVPAKYREIVLTVSGLDVR